jgi:hypothetical protein
MTLAHRRLLAASLTLALLLCSGAALAHEATAAPNPDFTPAVHQAPAAASRIDYISEGFETAVPPAGWTIMTTGLTYTWDQTDTAAHGGGYSAWLHYGPQGIQQDEWLVTPAIDLSAASAPMLEFFEMEVYWAGYGDHHNIAVSTTVPDDPMAFTDVAVWTPANHDIPDAFGDEPVVVDLSAYAGEPVVYLAFRYIGVWADDWYIDDVRIYEPWDHDVTAVAALPDGEQFAGGATVVPRAVVKNVGLNTESFDVMMEIAEAGTPVYSETASVAALAPGDEATVDFPGFVVGEGLYYEPLATTLLTGDQDATNDTAVGFFDTYTQSHVPMMFLFTNAGCAPCVQANQAMDAFMAGAGNAAALMRIHTWWPNASDIMYTANPEQITALTNQYGVNGVPDFWLDGLTGLGYEGAGAVAAMDAAMLTMSPLAVAPALWQIESEMLSVAIEIADPLPAGDYRLFVNITEDNIEYDGGNGEPSHSQVFRWQYPDLDGIPISTVLGYYSYMVNCPLIDSWSYDDLRATCYVQDVQTRRIWQAGTVFLHEIDDVTPVALSFFDVEAAPGRVALSWESATESAEFRLTRLGEAGSAAVDFASTQPGRYEAVDVVAAGGQFTYTLEGREAGEDWMLLRSENVAVDPAALRTALLGSHPNPFNPKTTIRLALAEAGPVTVRVFDTQGRLVATLFEGSLTAGEHELAWDGRTTGGHAAGSGVYFVQLQSGGKMDARKVVLAK